MFFYIIVAVADLLTKQLVFNCYLHRLTILIGVVVVFKIGAFLVERKKYPVSCMQQTIKNTNFFIFAFHWILLYWLASPLSRLTKGSDLSLTVIYFVQIILCCTISISLGIILNKLFPRLMKILNGR